MEIGRRMKIKAASGIMLILFLTFTLGISVNECQGFERWVPYVPSADLKFWMSNGISYINVSMTFPDSGFHVSDWGTVVRDRGQIWADSKIWDWTGYSFFWIITLSHTYDLGRLEEGNYTFTFKAWGFDVESVSFTVPAKVQLLLETDKDVYILGENVTITLRNIGTETVEIWGHPAWGIYTYPEESFVFPKYYAFLIWSLEPGENDTITWDQNNAFTNSLVDPGMYVVRDTKGWGLSVFFEITHLPPPPPEYIYIRPDGSVEGTDKIQRDGDIYTFTDNIYDEIVIERDNIVVDGAGCTLQGKGSGTGIDLSDRSNVTIKNMKIQAFWGGIYLDSSSNNTISGNNVTANNFMGIDISRSSNNTVFGNNITANTYCGIYLGSSSNNAISGNNIANNDYGIRLLLSHNNVISGNNITNNQDGVHMHYGSNHNTIFGNAITENTYNGIILTESSNNSISRNNMANNGGNGIALVGSSNNAISGNNITDNYGEGVHLTWSSNYNSISRNNITTNEYGIYLDESSNNKIYHNNFIDNTNQTFVQDVYTNIWDDGYPSGGNYWSDHTGQDLDVDGIGDTPYPIDADNEDRYPLIGPFNAFDAGTWNDIAYCVDVASNSTVSDFFFNPDEGAFLCFNVSGPEGTTGFCRVVIPKELLWVEDGQWTILVGGEPVEYVVIPDENCTYICFTYSHTTKTVEIIGTNVVPEFPTWTPILLILILLAVAIAITKRRLLKTPIH